MDNLDNESEERENYFNVNATEPEEAEAAYFEKPNNFNNNSVKVEYPVAVEASSSSKEMIAYENYYKQFLRDPGIEGRKASRLLFLRSFNNWIKATVINKYLNQLGGGHTNDLSIFDICCGRGGDLEKYFRSRIKLYVGADLSEESLKNALDRIIKLKNEKYKDLKTKCYFITEDVSNPNGHLLKKIPSEIQFDFVSCQFAMHYHFESEERVRTFLTNVVSRLNDGGIFIGTIIDSNVLVKRLRNRKYKDNIYLNEKFTFGNEFYAVKFYQKRFDKEKGPFGIKYGFYLEDSIDKKDEHGKIKFVGEYIVIFDVFVKICEEFGLYLIERKNFTDMYEENIENKYYRNLFRKMINEINISSKEKQWEIIQLYQLFAFRKGKDEPKRYNPVLKYNNLNIKDSNPVFITDKFE